MRLPLPPPPCVRASPTNHTHLRPKAIWEKPTKAVKNRGGEAEAEAETAGKKSAAKQRAKAKQRTGAGDVKGLKKRASSRFSKDKAIEELGDFEAIALLDGHLGRVGRVRRNEDVSRLEQAEGRLDLELAEALQRL